MDCSHAGYLLDRLRETYTDIMEDEMKDVLFLGACGIFSSCIATRLAGTAACSRGLSCRPFHCLSDRSYANEYSLVPPCAEYPAVLTDEESQ